MDDAQQQIDVATFIQWVDARESGRAELADFFQTRFRDEFKPAFDAWLATRPLTNANAPKTPFEMPQYRLKASADAEQLELLEVARTGFGIEPDHFASSLFFAGISTKLGSIGASTATLALGCVVFLGTLVWIATLPTLVSV